MQNITDQLDEYARGQIKLTDLPKELQLGAKDLVNDIQKIMTSLKVYLKVKKQMS